MSSARFPGLGENLDSPVKDGSWISATRFRGHKLRGKIPAKEMRGQDNWWGRPHPTGLKI